MGATQVQETSIDSYIDFLPKVGRCQKLIIDVFWIRRVSMPNLSNREIKEELEKYTGKPWIISTIPPRVFELREMGYLELSEKRKCTVSGKRVMCWELTRSARRNYTKIHSVSMDGDS